jgi:hypothetical protein
MYSVRMISEIDGSVVMSMLSELPPTITVEKMLLANTHKCYIDVCRLVDDPLSDTANFRDDVYHELEELE